jgi:hypothetical protein
VTEKSLIIVSGGDAYYFPLLKDQVDSIRDLPQGKNVQIGMLDGGLTQEQKDYFKSEGIIVVRPEWPSEKIRKKAKKREHLLINLNKSSLDLLFPEYEIILWLDGDTWMQTWDAVSLFILVAKKGKLAIVTKISRLRTSVMRMSPRLFGWVRARGSLYNNAKRARLTSSIIWSLVNKPTLNAGAYALHRQSPHWERWRHWQKICLKHGRLFSSDQLSLALTIYEDCLPYEKLPDICNYMGPWRVNKETNLLVDYFAPYEPASIVHMVGKATPSTLSGGAVPGIDENDNPVNIFLGYCPNGVTRIKKQ